MRTKETRGRKALPKGKRLAHQVFTRLDDAQTAKLDRMVERERERYPAGEVTRGSVLRMLVEQATE